MKWLQDFEASRHVPRVQDGETEVLDNRPRLRYQNSEILDTQRSWSDAYAEGYIGLHIHIDVGRYWQDPDHEDICLFYRKANVVMNPDSQLGVWPIEDDVTYRKRRNLCDRYGHRIEHSVLVEVGHYGDRFNSDSRLVPSVEGLKLLNLIDDATSDVTQITPAASGPFVSARENGELEIVLLGRDSRKFSGNDELIDEMVKGRPEIVNEFAGENGPSEWRVGKTYAPDVHRGVFGVTVVDEFGFLGFDPGASLILQSGGLIVSPLEFLVDTEKRSSGGGHATP